MVKVVSTRGNQKAKSVGMGRDFPKRNEAYSDRIKSMASKCAPGLRFKASMDNHIIASLIKSTNWKFCRIRRIRNGVMRFNENTKYSPDFEPTMV